MYKNASVIHAHGPGTVSRKVVNRKLGRTTVFTIYDHFTKLADFRYTTYFGHKLLTGWEQS